MFPPTRRFAPLAFALSLAVPAPLHAQATRPLTNGEIQALYAAGKFEDAGQACRRALALARPPAAAYDRHALYLLGADCSLHLKQAAAATALLNSGLKEAQTANHDVQAAELFALLYLIQNSPNNVYVSKFTSEKFDILDKSVHAKLYAALFSNLLDHCQKSLQAAQQASSLAPLADALKSWPALHAVEITNNGAAKKSDQFAADAQKWAGQTIQTSLNNFDARIQRIQIDSNVNALGKIRPRKPAGISDADLANLHQIQSDCRLLPDAIKSLNDAFHAPLPDLSTHAQNVLDHVNTLLAQNKRVGNGKT
jgi:hypothetical protein